MGYTTDFKGAFKFDRPIEEKHKAYIFAFNRTRRMKRDPLLAEQMPDPVRVSAGLPIGNDGGFFVGNTENYGQNDDKSVLSHNTAPGQVDWIAGGDFDKIWNGNERLISEGKCQPGLWCQWTISEEGDLVWDEGEKFYNYTEWLKYLIENFLKPWGYVINGEVSYWGEDRSDHGVIKVVNNVVDKIPA